MQANADTIRTVVQEVLAQLGKAPKSTTPARDGDFGVFQSVDQAVAAANEAFKKLSEAPLAARATVIECVRRICDEQAEELGTLIPGNTDRSSRSQDRKAEDHQAGARRGIHANGRGQR